MREEVSLRNLSTLLLVIAAFAAGYWYSQRPSGEAGAANYALENGQLVRIEPSGARTPIGPPISAKGNDRIADAKDDDANDNPSPANDDESRPPAPSPSPRAASVPRAPEPEPIPAAQAPTAPVPSEPDAPAQVPSTISENAPLRELTPPSPPPQKEKAPVAPILSTLDPPSPPPAPAPAPTAYKIYPNLDLRGGDYDVLRQSDLQRCVSTCKANPQCRAYTFDKWNGFCFLKAEIKILRLNPRSVTGVSQSAGEPPRANTKPDMERYRGKSFRGAGYRSHRASYDACEKSCEGEKACVAFTFQKSDSQCRLFDVTEQYFPDEMADSGGKLQRP
jgi:hypothetical protein